MYKSLLSHLFKKSSNNTSSLLFKNIKKTQNIQFYLYKNHLHLNQNYQYQNRYHFSSQTPKIQQILQQVQKIKQQHGENSMQMMDSLHKLSFTYAQEGNIQQAIKIYENLVKAFKKNIEDPRSPIVGDTLKNLQTLYRKAGKIMQQIPLTLQLIEIRLKQHGEDHKTLANQYHQLGVAYYYIGNYDQALNNYKVALRIREKLFGTNSLQYLETENNIGTYYYSQGKFDEAKQIFSRNLEKIRKLEEFNNKMLVTPLGNLAMIEEHQQNYSQAIKNYQEIQQIFLSMNQANSYYLANIYHSMGIVYLKMGDPKKSLQYHQKSLQINKKNYQQNHPNIAGNYHNIALCNQYLGNFEQALKNYDISISMKKKTLGEKNESIAQSLSNVGMINKVIRKYSQSRKAFEEAIEIIKAVSNEEEHPVIGDICLNIGTTYLEEHNAEKASEYLKRSQNILEKLFDQNHPKIAELYFNLAKFEFVLQRNYPKARQFLQKSIKNYETLAPNHPTLYLMYSMKASCYFEQKNFQGAVQNYQKAYDILQTSGKGSSQQIAANTGLLQYQIGATYCELKDFKNAQQRLLQGLQIFEKKFNQAYQTLIEIYFLLGNTQRELGKLTESKQNFKKANDSMQILLKNAPGHPILLKKQQEIKRCMNL